MSGHRWQMERWDRKRDEWMRWTVGSLEECLEDVMDSKMRGERARLTYEPEGYQR